MKFYGAEYSAAIQSLVAGLPAPSIQSGEEGVKISEPAQVSQRALELQYLDQLRFEILLNTEKYTPLAGESRHKKIVSASQLAPVVMRPEYVLLGREKQDLREVRRFDNAVDEILSLRRVVVLGEPGAGKTTTLWKLARQLVNEAIADPSKPIPLVIRLGKWTDDTQPLQDFIAQEVGELGRFLPALLSEKRAVLLLDGLNEIPVSQRRTNREAKDQQVKSLIETHPGLLVAVSCRARDYTMDLGFDRIEIQPLDPVRIQEFCDRYLGEEKGEQLFHKLIGEKAIKTEQQFLDWEAGRIHNPAQVFWLEHELPAGLKWGYQWDTASNVYWERWVQQREAPASLLVLAYNPYMLSMLAQVFHDQSKLPENRGELFRNFAMTLLTRERLIEIDPQSKQPVMNEAAQKLLDGLAHLAYEMQVRRAVSRQVDEAENDALTALPVSSAQIYLTEQQLYQAASTSLLNVGEYVRFTHQLLQEYFAAHYMQSEIEAGRLSAKSIWKAENWWGPTNWEEATILLAGLYSDDCTPIVKWVAEANPEMAARCIAQSGSKTPNETREWLRRLWLPRLTNEAEMPQARAAVGRALGLTKLDDRKGVGLDENGLPDMDWVEIPAGEFIYQDDQKLKLAVFEIARYPITYAQFQAFIDARDGFYNTVWWEGPASTEKHRNAPGDQSFQYSNHPRERVSWYDAVAFCRWLSAKLGYEVRLPTEQEWEKAARGTDWRKYPYGNNFDANKGNTNETGIGQTTAVGMFPKGTSPYGVMDMSGNVFEWCLNEYENPDNTQHENSETRVQRGGSWYFNPAFARTTYRYEDDAHYRSGSSGFRVIRPVVSATFL